MSQDQLLASIISYLSGPFKNSASDAESVDVAIQCLTDAAGLDEAKKSSLAVSHSLPAIFAAGLAALNNPTTSSTATSTTSTPTDPKYTQFLELLASRGFFGNATPGSAEYSEKLELAKKKFVAKYGSGGESDAKTATSTSTSQSTSQSTYTPVPVTDAQKARAEEFKVAGNSHLGAQHYDEAIESYTQAITQNPNNAIYWANRAAAHQHLKQYEKAVTDCREAIRVDPSYAKGHYRLGAALFQLDRIQDAITAYEKALSLSTNDPNMSANIREQLDLARSKLANPFGGGASGGLDFASLLNNPALANLMNSMGGGGGSGGLDFGALMSNPAIQQMAQQFMGNMGNMGGNASASSSTSSSTSTSSSSSSSSSSGNNDFLNNLMSNPEILALKDDPTLAPVFADIQANGESALYKYMSDPNVMSKLSGIVGKLFGGRGNQ